MSACRFLETTMTTKEQIIHELDQLSETSMQQVLKFVRSLKQEFDADDSEPDIKENAVWKAYLTSKREREEVYRRLADS